MHEQQYERRWRREYDEETTVLRLILLHRSLIHRMDHHHHRRRNRMVLGVYSISNNVVKSAMKEAEDTLLLDNINLVGVLYLFLCCY